MRFLRDQLELFRLALLFLTRLPVGSCASFSESRFPHAVIYFPAVGLVVGGIAAGVLSLTASVVPLWLAIGLSMLASVMVTGCFHEDGLADAVDGLVGGWDAAKRLEIMKDSRIGSFGAIGLWFVLVFKLGLLWELAQKGMPVVLPALLIGHVQARGAAVILIQFLPYVRETDGRSKPAMDTVRRWHLVPVLGTCLLVGFVLAGISGLAALAGALLTSAALGFYFQRRIGGITGDCLGATKIVAELVIYLILLKWL